MELIDSEVEKVEWILAERKLGVAERNNLEIYLAERKREQSDLKNICMSHNIKWYPKMPWSLNGREIC
jgi:hypothetical protein